jgi:hypothetical protein
MKCSEMKKGYIYACDDCGMELQVMQECTCVEDKTCSCEPDECEIMCCGKALVLKK